MVLRRGSTLIGVAANARFGGLAVTIDGELVYWRVARWTRGSAGPLPVAAFSLLEPVLRHFHPVALVVLVDDGLDGRSARSRTVVERTILPALSSIPLPKIEVRKSDLVRDLGLSRSTTIALRRELLRRTPLPAVPGQTKVVDAREKERYWECAVLASGATRVPLRQSGIVHA